MLKKALFTVAVFLGLLLPTPIYASYLYFSPSEINTNSDLSFDVQVRLNTLKDNINAATIDINYPSDILNVTGINYDSSALGLPVESSSKDGVIKITRGNFQSISGDVKVGTITFKAQKSGKTQLTFGSGSKVPKLFDFSESLDQSQNGTETISVNTGSNSSQSSGGESNSCKARENVIKTNSKKIVDSGENIFNTIDNVSKFIQNNFQNSAAMNGDYQFKIANVQLQKTLAQQNLRAVQNDLNSYACDKSNAKTQLAQFKKDINTLKQSLKNYRQAVKDLIGVLIK